MKLIQPVSSWYDAIGDPTVGANAQALSPAEHNPVRECAAPRGEHNPET